MSKTLVVVNPYAAGGKVKQVWNSIEAQLWQQLGELVVAVTHHPREIFGHLQAACAAGLSRIVSIGGDGTNHALINALAEFRQRQPDCPPITYGIIPVGTGRDWARSRGIPLKINEAITWLGTATPKPTDIGLLDYLNGQQKQVYFLNIASVGLGGYVDARINRITTRRPWTFLKSTLESIVTYQPQHMRVILDGSTWFDDKAFVAVIANGTTFGHGMKIAPNATPHDGLFDVVLLENTSRMEILWAFQRVYRGTHLTHPAIHSARAREIHIESANGALDIDLDGEWAKGEGLTFKVQPGALPLLS